MSQQAPVPRLRASQLAGRAFAAWLGGLLDWLTAILLPLVILYFVYFGIWHLLTTQSLEELGQQTQSGSLRDTASMVVNMIVLTLFGVAWHRRILLGEKPRLLPAVGSQHVRYLLWLLILGILLFLISALITALAAGSMAGGGMALQAGIVAVIGFAGMLYLLGRISPLFSALAIGERLGLAGAWRMTQGQGMAIFFGYLLVILPIFFLSAALLTIVVGDIQEEHIQPGTVMSQQEFQEILIGAYWTTQSVAAVIGFLSATLAVGVASAVYKELR